MYIYVCVYSYMHNSFQYDGLLLEFFQKLFNIFRYQKEL